MKLSLIYHTIKHLKPIQIRYQFWYRIRKKRRKLIGFKYSILIEKEGNSIKLATPIPRYTSFNDYTVTFLNQSKTFPKNDIDWNYSEYGKLWTYNLNYFDFLIQPEMEPKIGWELIENYILNLTNKSTGLEPYPISLRGINWIKFISKFSSSHSPIFSPSQLHTFSSSLYAQYQILLDNLEYHLMGNHLLENGFSLLFGGFYFKDDRLYKKAKKIIAEQLKEQILNDGGHFELSPMYHQIILDRLLDCINLVQNNLLFEDQEPLLQLMEEKAEKMIYWLNQISFSNGQIPMLNDSAPDIAPSTRQINDYASRLNLIHVNSSNFVQHLTDSWTLSKSGYRRFNGTNYECIIDIGPIGPLYQPGHAHADTFNFLLNIYNQPYIVDSGVSTYNPGETRMKERGTSAHNTVTVMDENSSEIWGSFRVARRAKVDIIKDYENNFIAQHNGYRKLKTIHQREWNFSEHQINILDTIKGKCKEGKAHFWISPSIIPEIKNQKVYSENAVMTFQNAVSVELVGTQIPDGFNLFADNYKIEVVFKHYLKTTIKIR